MITEGDNYTLEPYDIVCIFHDSRDGRYYLSIMVKEEPPEKVKNLPVVAPNFEKCRVDGELPLVYLTPKFLHTGGGESLKQERQFLKKLCREFHIPAENTVSDQAYPKEGDTAMLLLDWRKLNLSLRYALDNALFLEFWPVH